MKKHDFYVVRKYGEDIPRAIFYLEKDANLYAYVRFSSQAKVAKEKHRAEKIIETLAYQEGIAFNRMMWIRGSYGRGHV